MTETSQTGAPQLPDISGYRVESRIGEGGMAIVYRAVQEAFERTVALKVLAPQLTKDEEFAKRFLREARIVGGLSHAHIVPVYEVGERNGCYFLSMEWLQGGDLRTVMAQGISASFAKDILLQIARALRYAHSQGFIHRDIKPDNILFRDPETAVLTDFGIARNLDSQPNVTEITTVNSVVGSPSYMSPEQTRGEPLDARSDIYSLGVVAYLLLTGTLPHTGRNLTEIAIQRHQQQRPLLPAQWASLQPLFDRWLAYDREQRYADCADLIKDLEALELTAEVDAELTAINPAVTEFGRHAKSTAKTRATLSGKFARRAGVLVLLLVAAILGYRWFTPAIPVVDETPVLEATPVTTEVSEKPLPDPTPALRAPTAPEYFAFRDALAAGTVARGKDFLLQYPESILADLVRVHLLGSTDLIPTLQEQADAGDAVSQLVLSELYSAGWGVPLQPQTARDYATRAMHQQDVPLTRYHLGTLLLADADVTPELRQTAISHLQAAADGGFYLAQTLMGNLSFEGEQMPQDIANSLVWFEQAAAQGDRNALFNLGQIYDTGMGIEAADSERAQYYFRRADTLGHPQAKDYLR